MISNIEPIPARSHLLDAQFQSINLDPIKQNEVTEIMIRNRQGNVPNLTFNPAGGLYDNDKGIIKWGSLGENSLSWSSGINFSGTITQYVEEIPEQIEVEVGSFKELQRVINEAESDTALIVNITNSFDFEETIAIDSGKDVTL